MCVCVCVSACECMFTVDVHCLLSGGDFFDDPLYSLF